MSRISLCVIARDEEALLPGLLASVRGAVDEVVLVDTGSVDRTPELARAAGARVLSRPWDGDFAAPRNLALAHAGGEWVLQLDADERLAPGAGEAIRRAVRGATFDAGVLRLHDASRLDATAEEILSGRARLGPPSLLPRLLRRTDDLRYEGIVHEGVRRWYERRGARGLALDADILHLGAIPALRAARGKSERNVALLRRRLAADPDDAVAMGYLALELLGRGALDEATAIAERGWALVAGGEGPDPCVHRLAVTRAVCALNEGAAERVDETLAVAQRRAGTHPDYRHLAGCAEEVRAGGAPAASAERAGHLDAAIAAHREALALLARGGFSEVLAAREEVVRVRLGGALLDRGAPGDAAAALPLVEPALGAGPDAWVIAAGAAAALGARADAQAFLREAIRRARAGFASRRIAERAKELAVAISSGR